jgi:hypothetical protein
LADQTPCPSYCSDIALSIADTTSFVPRNCRARTIAHELGHVFCGHLGAVKHGSWADNSNAPEDRLNLDIGSHTYLAGYLSDEPKLLPDSSLDTVLKAVGKIEEMMRGAFRIRHRTGASRLKGARP